MLVSSLTGLDSVALLHTTNGLFSCSVPSQTGHQQCNDTSTYKVSGRVFTVLTLRNEYILVLVQISWGPTRLYVTNLI